MGRPKSNDHTSLNKIILTLSEAAEGLWIMEISRRTKLNPNTVAYHVRQHPELFTEMSVDGPKKAFFKLIRLRPGATTKTGAMLTKILKEHEGR
jgi:hypothetical protein